MTRRPRHEDDQPPRRRRQAAGGHRLRNRLLGGALVLALGFAGVVLMFDRQNLPAKLKDNAYVAKVYKERDAAVAATDAIIDAHRKAPETPPDANAEMKQQGYKKDDRAKLEAIITNGSKGQ